jgi:hypothetical protein
MDSLERQGADLDRLVSFAAFSKEEGIHATSLEGTLIR